MKHFGNYLILVGIYNVNTYGFDSDVIINNVDFFRRMFEDGISHEMALDLFHKRMNFIKR